MGSLKPLSFFAVALALLFVLNFTGAEAQNRSAKHHFHKRTSRKISNFTQRVKFPKSKRVIVVGGGIGISNYLGDITPTSSPLSIELLDTRWNISAYVEKRFNYNFSARVGLQFARISGSDFTSAGSLSNENQIGRYGRNLHFRNNIIELNAVGVFDLFATTGNSIRRQPIIPYGLIGIAAFFHNPQALGPVGSAAEGEWTALHDIATEPNKNYSRFQVAIPLGIGVKYRVSNNIDIGLEIGYRVTFTDFLDDVSGSYYSQEEFIANLTEGTADDELAMRFSNRSAEGYEIEPNAPLISADLGVGHRGGNAVAREDFNNPEIRNILGDPISIITASGDDYFYMPGTFEDGQPRGNPDDNDYYFITNVTVRYMLGAFVNRKPKYR